MAIARLKIWNKGVDSVGANSSKVIDTVSLVAFRHMDYVFNFFNDSEEKTYSLELRLHKVLTTPNIVRRTVPFKFGDAMETYVTASVVGSNVVLSAINNESYDVDLKFNRMIL